MFNISYPLLPDCQTNFMILQDFIKEIFIYALNGLSESAIEVNHNNNQYLLKIYYMSAYAKHLTKSSNKGLGGLWCYQETEA